MKTSTLVNVLLVGIVAILAYYLFQGESHDEDTVAKNQVATGIDKSAFINGKSSTNNTPVAKKKVKDLSKKRVSKKKSELGAELKNNKVESDIGDRWGYAEEYQDNKDWSAAGRGIYDDAKLRNEFEYTQLLEDPAERRRALVDLARLMAATDSDLALELLQSITDPSDQIVFARSMVAALVTKNPEKAATWAWQIDDADFRYKSIGMIMPRWAKVDVDGAIKWAAEIEDMKTLKRAQGEIATSWASYDIEGAYNWAIQLNDQKIRTLAIVNIGRALASQDPKAAAEWASEFTDKSMGDSILADAVAKWVVKDITSVSEWVAQMPDGRGKIQSASRVSRAWAQKDPYAAAEWALKITDPKTRDNSLATIATVWSTKEPKLAADWAATFPDGNARISAISGTVSQWAKSDPYAAGDWVKSLSVDDKSRERAYLNVVSVWSRKDPKEAAEWVNNLSDGTIKNNSMRVVGRQWLISSRADATEWINNSTMVQAEKEKLLKK